MSVPTIPALGLWLSVSSIPTVNLFNGSISSVQLKLSACRLVATLLVMPSSILPCTPHSVSSVGSHPLSFRRLPVLLPSWKWLFHPWITIGWLVVALHCFTDLSPTPPYRLLCRVHLCVISQYFYSCFAALPHTVTENTLMNWLADARNDLLLRAKPSTSPFIVIDMFRPSPLHLLVLTPSSIRAQPSPLPAPHPPLDLLRPLMLLPYAHITDLQLPQRFHLHI